jgi:LPXTG-motif cell wall-anchored protein
LSKQIDKAYSFFVFWGVLALIGGGYYLLFYKRKVALVPEKNNDPVN